MHQNPSPVTILYCLYKKLEEIVQNTVHKKEPSTIQKTILYENSYAMLYFI